MITEVFKAMANGKVLEYVVDEKVIKHISSFNVNSTIICTVTFRDGSTVDVINPDYITRSVV